MRTQPYLDKKTGYVMVYRPDGSRTTQHRMLMEDHLGRKLDFNEVVHHKNEDTLDNRLENLEVMSRGNHTKHHHKPAEVVYRKCQFCGDQFAAKMSKIRYKKSKTPYRYCSRSCGAKAQWKRGAVSKHFGTV